VKEKLLFCVARAKLKAFAAEKIIIYLIKTKKTINCRGLFADYCTQEEEDWSAFDGSSFFVRLNYVLCVCVCL